MLGAPLGSEAFVQQELHRKRETQDQLLTRLPCCWGPAVRVASLALLRFPTCQLLAPDAPAWRD